ncbi:hypothetical protein J4402_01845 [Candidatus Pacearchaeota archaeon]|nr:hypothetical protein [Candidatus Pacearchaeota archaeon]
MNKREKLFGRMKGLLFILLILSGTVLLAGRIDALGITPARASVDFVSGVEKMIGFNVINTDGKDMNLVVYASGELNKSIFIFENMISMGADEETKQISYNIKMPADLSPGMHSADIVVLEVPKEGGGIGAVVGVIAQLNVYVPYPGKYAEAEMHISGAEQEGIVQFVIPVVSRGDVDLVSVHANVDIYNSIGEKVDSFNTLEVSASKEKRGEIVHNWKADVPAGVYSAKATVIYDGETLKLEKSFNVGEMILDLQQIEVRDFKLGEIAKFEMLVENKWGEEIKGVYTLMNVFNKEGEVMAEFKSPTENIPGFEKKVLVSYWDTGGVKKGTYDSSVYLIYGQKSAQKDLQLKVSDDMIEIVGFGYVISSKKLFGDRDLLIKVLVIGIVVLAVMNIAWFVFLRKRLFRGKELKRGRIAN